MCKLCNGRYQVSLHYTSILYKYLLYIDTRVADIILYYLLYIYYTILLLMVILMIVCVF